MADDAATETTDVSVEPEAQPQEAQEESTTQDEERTEGESPSGEESTEDQKPKNRLQDRFSELTQRAKEAEQKAEAAAQAQRDAEERIKFYEQQYGQPEETPFPTLESVGYDEAELQTKIAEWYRQNQATSSRNAYLEQQRIEAQRGQQQAAQARLNVFKARAEAFAAQHEDFQQVVTNPAIPMGMTVVQAAMESPNGPAIAYHIGKNPDLAMRLNSMSPGQAYMEIGRLEQKLTTPVTPKSPSAPEPTRPVGGKAKSDKDPAKMSTDEYVAWRKRQRAGN